MTKAELLIEIDKNCTQQGSGSGSLPGPILTEIVNNHMTDSVAGAAIADLNTGTATTAQIATAVNLILARLRAAGIIAA